MTNPVKGACSHVADWAFHGYNAGVSAVAKVTVRRIDNLTLEETDPLPHKIVKIALAGTLVAGLGFAGYRTFAFTSKLLAREVGSRSVKVAKIFATTGVAVLVPIAGAKIVAKFGSAVAGCFARAPNDPPPPPAQT